MKTVSKTLLAALLAASPAFAAQGSATGNGLLMTAFLGFAALIVTFQFIPVLVLFGGMLKGLFPDQGGTVAQARKQ